MAPNEGSDQRTHRPAISHTPPGPAPGVPVPRSAPAAGSHPPRERSSPKTEAGPHCADASGSHTPRRHRVAGRPTLPPGPARRLPRFQCPRKPPVSPNRDPGIARGARHSPDGHAGNGLHPPPETDPSARSAEAPTRPADTGCPGPDPPGPGQNPGPSPSRPPAAKRAAAAPGPAIEADPPPRSPGPGCSTPATTGDASPPWIPATVRSARLIPDSPSTDRHNAPHPPSRKFSIPPGHRRCPRP